MLVLTVLVEAVPMALFGWVTEVIIAIVAMATDLGGSVVASLDTTVSWLLCLTLGTIRACGIITEPELLCMSEVNNSGAWWNLPLGCPIQTVPGPSITPFG